MLHRCYSRGMADTKRTTDQVIPGQRLVKPGPVSGSVTRQPFHGYVTVQGRGTVAIPPEVRKRYRMDDPGAQVEITEREDGVIELRPTIAVPANEAWFWDERWQEGERAVEADIAAGRVTTFANADEFAAHLDSMTEK